MLKSAFSCLQRCRWQYWSILIRLAVVDLLCPKSVKSSQILSKFELIQFKVIQGHRSWCQSKAHMQLPISHLKVTLDVFPTVFETLTHFSFKIACFPPHRCLTPPRGGTPCNINIIYTLLKSTFNGLLFRRHYGSIFIRLAVVAFQNRKIMQNSDKVWPYSSSRSSILVSIESH